MPIDIELARRFERHFDGLQSLILDLERLAGQVEDGGLGAELRALLSDLLVHWDEIGDFADQLAQPATENRRRQRVRVLGSAIVRADGATVEAQGQCVDLSAGGLRLRVSQPLTLGRRYELAVLMPGAAEALVYTTQASWCQARAGGDGYWVGFEYVEPGA